MRIIRLAALFILFLPLLTSAQNPTKWSLESNAKGTVIHPGEAYDAKLTAVIEPGWHLYALDQLPGGPIATTIKIAEGRPLEITGEIKSPKPITAADPNFIVDDKPLQTKYFQDKATFEFSFKATSEISDSDIAFDVLFQLCNDTFCLPPRTKREHGAAKSAARAEAAASSSSSRPSSAKPSSAPSPPSPDASSTSPPSPTA